MYLPNKVIKALSIIIQTFRKIGYCSDEFRDPIIRHLIRVYYAILFSLDLKIHNFLRFIEFKTL